MTNYEKNREKIEAITNLGISFAIEQTTNDIVLCDDTVCGDCLFGPDCDSAKFKWAYEDVPTTDWSKVPVDTRIYVKSSPNYKDQPAYFAKYEDGVVFAWQDGRTSFTTKMIRGWEYAKLAEEVE